MDLNKITRLNDIKYSVHKCCGLCKNFNEGYVSELFGTCDIHKYFHLKHKQERSLSICIYGSCENFEPGTKLYSLGYYNQFSV